MLLEGKRAGLLSRASAPQNAASKKPTHRLDAPPACEAACTNALHEELCRVCRSRVPHYLAGNTPVTLGCFPRKKIKKNLNTQQHQPHTSTKFSSKPKGAPRRRWWVEPERAPTAHARSLSQPPRPCTQPGPSAQPALLASTRLTARGSRALSLHFLHFALRIPSSGDHQHHAVTTALNLHTGQTAFCLSHGSMHDVCIRWRHGSVRS
mmetsp:Transcript_107363/g.311964  ORF Transcript_107363/g.311964 Transcript_107363/m.311964 type:complete len:208 (-) Transcript_107363:916-1539(-)